MIRARLLHIARELWFAAAWAYAQFLRWCVAVTDSYMRSAFEDGITNTRSLQAWSEERDRDMQTIDRLENLRHLNNHGGKL